MTEKLLMGILGKVPLLLKRHIQEEVSSPGCYPLLDVMARTVAALL